MLLLNRVPHAAHMAALFSCGCTLCLPPRAQQHSIWQVKALPALAQGLWLNKAPSAQTSIWHHVVRPQSGVHPGHTARITRALSADITSFYGLGNGMKPRHRADTALYSLEPLSTLNLPGHIDYAGQLLACAAANPPYAVLVHGGWLQLENA